MKKRYFFVTFCLLYSWFLAIPVNSAQLDNTLSVIEKCWVNRDGSSSAIVNSSIAELLVLQPLQTLTWLKSREDIYSNFIERWQYDVFTDYSGKNYYKMEQLKNELYGSLNNCISDDADIQRLKKHILKELEGIEIRKID